MKTRVISKLLALLFVLPIGKSVCVRANPPIVAKAEAKADAAGQGAGFKQTVTVTSDGKKTIKKTITVRDGVESVVTEVTDENGKTVTTVDEPQPAKMLPPAKDSAWLGIRVKELAAVLRSHLDLKPGEGAEIDAVAPDSPASRASISPGDLLLTLGDSPIANPVDLTAALEKSAPGQILQASLMKKGVRTKVDVTLAARPAGAAVQGSPPPGMAAGHPGREKAELRLEGAGVGDSLDRVINDPNLPDDFKNSVRQMRENLRQFERQNRRP